MRAGAEASGRADVRGAASRPETPAASPGCMTIGSLDPVLTPSSVHPDRRAGLSTGCRRIEFPGQSSARRPSGADDLVEVERAGRRPRSPAGADGRRRMKNASRPLSRLRGVQFARVCLRLDPARALPGRSNRLRAVRNRIGRNFGNRGARPSRRPARTTSWSANTSRTKAIVVVPMRRAGRRRRDTCRWSAGGSTARRATAAGGSIGFGIGHGIRRAVHASSQ